MLSPVELLRPRYRSLLRFTNKRPFISKLSVNVSLIVCFAVSLCAAAYLFCWIDEIFSSKTESSGLWNSNPPVYLRDRFNDLHTCNRIGNDDLKSILKQRGVTLPQILERDELEALIDSTGKVTDEELVAARQFSNYDAQSQVVSTADVLLHQRLLSAWNDGPTDASTKNAQSVVFDSESAFVERVDDNKDSVWLLAVVATTFQTSDISPASAISSNIWGALVHQYSPFGFKLGLINCHRLPSVCHDRGFIAADLVLALPKGGDRIKDSVQFRPYPRFTDNGHRQPVSYSSSFVLKHIRSWLNSVLSERVPPIKDFWRIHPPSISVVTTGSPAAHTPRFSWLRHRPQPLHVIWLPHSMTQTTEGLLSIPDYPPFVLLALSVPFTGRVRFWTLPNTNIPALQQVQKLESQTESLVGQRSIGSLFGLFGSLNCPKNTTYLIITPEAHCLSFGDLNGEYLAYTNLGMYLRFMFPSADDSLLIFTLLFNILAILNTAVEAGKLMAHKESYSANADNPWSINGPHTGLEVVRSILRLAQRGWTSHAYSRPFPDGNPYNTVQSSTSSTDTHVYSNPRKQLTLWMKTCLLDVISTNFLILISVLPLINLLTLQQSSVIINTFLWLLRSTTNWSIVINLRLAIVAGHITWTRASFVLFLCWSFVTVICAHFYHVTHSSCRRNRSRAILRHLNGGASVQFVNRVTRFLVHSDVDSATDTAGSGVSSSSSDGNSTSHLAESTQPFEPRALIRRLTRLHQALQNERFSAGFLNNATSTFENVARNEPVQSVPTAYIFTWHCSNVVDSQNNDCLSMSTNHSKHDILPSASNGNSSDTRSDHWTETGDEGDSSDVSSVPSCRRRRRRRRRVLPPHTCHSVASNSSNGSLESLADSIVSCRESIGWPSWVIPSETCVVCWRTFRPPVRLGALPCGHGFHDSCIRRWLDTGALDCPVCRWPACAPHLRQQRQMIGQLLSVIRSAIPDVNHSLPPSNPS